MPFTAPIFVKLTFAEWISSVSDFTQIGQAWIEAGEGIQGEKTHWLLIMGLGHAESL
jgi:hypothetical protein